MRITRLTAGALALALSVTACGGEDKGGARNKSFADGTTMERLNEAQKLRVGTEFNQPGFGLKGLSGKPEGFQVEIAKIVASELGIDEDKIEWTELPSAVREQVIQQHKVDIMVASYTINDQGREVIDFAGPYYIAGQSILVKRADTSITGPNSFKDGTKKVCSVANSAAAANIEKYLKNKATQLVLFDIYTKCVDALKGGQVDAVSTDNVILTGFIAGNEGQFKLAGQAFTEEPYVIGIEKGDTAFRYFINQSLEKAIADSRYQKAWAETAGKFDPTAQKVPKMNNS